MAGETPGRFCWYDLMTTDPDGALQFYSSVTGWGSELFEGGGQPYDMWTAGGKPIGGRMRLPDEAAAAGAPSHWLAYITAPDVDGTANRASELGGSILVPPTEIPNVGRFAVIADPDGAVFALFAPLEGAPDHPGMPGVGEFSWHELMTSDYEKGFDFYRQLFGWATVEDMDMGEHGIYRIYGAGGPPLGGMMTRPPEMPVSAWLFYIRTDDIDAALERVTAGGGTIVNGPMEVPGGDRVAQ